MKSSRHRHERLGKLIFLIPVIVLVALVVYGFFLVTAPGTLKVEAIAQDKYVAGQAVPIQVSVTVAGPSGTETGTTNASFSLDSGTYTVTYVSAAGYTAPLPVTIGVPHGQTVFALGTYQAIAKVVSIGQSGFNATKVAAVHGVTPVIWINTSGLDLSVSIQNDGYHPLEPGQNFTQIFQNPGSFGFQIVGSNTSGIVQVG